MDNLYKWRARSCTRLDAIEDDARTGEAAGRWYAEQLGVDVGAARDSVAADLRLLRMQFATLPQLVDDIDARNARVSGLKLGAHKHLCPRWDMVALLPGRAQGEADAAGHARIGRPVVGRCRWSVSAFAGWVLLAG